MIVRAIGMTTLILVTSCAGSVVIDHDIDAKVSVAGANEAMHGTAYAIQRVPRPAGSLQLFDTVRYVGELLEWHFATHGESFGGTVTNRSLKRLCLRFDQAQVASNLHPEKVPLLVYAATYRLPDGRYVKEGSTIPKYRTFFAAPSLCLDGGSAASVSLSLDLRQLYPSSRLFNVKLVPSSSSLADKGIGNALFLGLPIEFDGRAQQLSVELIAKDTGTRISYY